MGADAWYWIHSYHPSYEDRGRGVVTEMRRCESGIRTWRADQLNIITRASVNWEEWRYRGRYLHSGGTGMSSRATYHHTTRELKELSDQGYLGPLGYRL